MGQSAVEVAHAGPVSWIRLRRPEVLNALSPEMIDGLDRALDEILERDGAHVVVVAGTGRAFCAGADLKTLHEDGESDREVVTNFIERAGNVLTRLANLPMPTIAAVNGLAIAGGLELILACDLVVAVEGVKIGDGHAKFGLVPGAGATARLPRVVGANVAKYLAFTGDLIEAEQMMALGLVNDVVPADRLEEHVTALAASIASNSSEAVGTMKHLIDAGLEVSLEDALGQELDAMRRHAGRDDFQEGLAAFNQKRDPEFPSNRARSSTT